MNTIVNQVSSAWFDNKLLRKSLQYNYNIYITLCKSWHYSLYISQDLVPPLVISIMGKFEQILQSWERFKGHKNSE